MPFLFLFLHLLYVGVFSFEEVKTMCRCRPTFSKMRCWQKPLLCWISKQKMKMYWPNTIWRLTPIYAVGSLFVFISRSCEGKGGGGGTTILGDFTVVYINLVVTQNNFPFLLGEGCIFVFSQQSDLAKPAVVSALTFCICSDFKGWFQICLCCSQIWIWTLTSAGFNLGWQTCCRYWKIKSKQEWFLYRLCGGKILEGGHI